MYQLMSNSTVSQSQKKKIAHSFDSLSGHNLLAQMKSSAFVSFVGVVSWFQVPGT